jgi:hypothetical protein
MILQRLHAVWEKHFAQIIMSATYPASHTLTTRLLVSEKTIQKKPAVKTKASRFIFFSTKSDRRAHFDGRCNG